MGRNRDGEEEGQLRKERLGSDRAKKWRIGKTGEKGSKRIEMGRGNKNKMIKMEIKGKKREEKVKKKTQYTNR